MNGWSYSAYSTALICLRKYKYCFIDKLEPDYQDGDMAFGSALHSAINSILHGEDGYEIFKLYWDSYKDKPLVYSRFKWKELEEIGYTHLRKFIKLHASEYKVEIAEKRFYATYAGVSYEGTPDFYGMYKGKLSLRDFKTSGYNYDKEKKLLATQLYLYAYLAISNGLKPPETLGYTVFNKGTQSIQDLTWEFNEVDMHKTLTDFMDYVDVLEKKDRVIFPRNLNSCIFGTKKCSFWSRCHGTKEQTTS